MAINTMSNNDEKSLSKVSIGMPTYNGAKFISAAIESILSQKYTYFELIISDDASTDETEEIVMKYCRDDLRIKYIRQQENIGANQNFKKVLEAATGEYFMFASQDDTFSSNWLSGLISSLRGTNNCASFGSTIYIDEIGNTINSTANKIYFKFGENNGLRRVKFLFTPHLTGKMILLYSIFPTALIRNLCINDTKITGIKSEDLHFIFLTLTKMKYIPVKGCYLYKRVHSESDSARNSYAKKINGSILKTDDESIYSNSFFKKLMRMLFPVIELTNYIKKLSKSEMFLAIITAPFFLPYHAIYGIYLMLRKKVNDVV